MNRRNIFIAFIFIVLSLGSQGSQIAELTGNHHLTGNIDAEFFDRVPTSAVAPPKSLRTYSASLEAWYFAKKASQIILLASGSNKELAFLESGKEPRLWILNKGYGFYFSRARRTWLDDGLFQAVSPYFHILYSRDFLADSNLQRQEKPDPESPQSTLVIFSTDFQKAHRDFILTIQKDRLLRLEESFDLPGGGGSTFSRKILYSDYDDKNRGFPKSVVTEFYAPYPKRLYPKPLLWVRIRCKIDVIEDKAENTDPTELADLLAQGFTEVLGEGIAPEARPVVRQNFEETESPKMKDAVPIPQGAKIVPLDSATAQQNKSKSLAKGRHPFGRTFTSSLSYFLIILGSVLAIVGVIIAIAKKIR